LADLDYIPIEILAYANYAKQCAAIDVYLY